jgi:hypothetical protein
MADIIITLLLAKHLADADKFNGVVTALGVRLSEHADKHTDTEVLAQHLVLGTTAVKRRALDLLEQAMIAEGVLACSA